jgi:hypothetical protein
MSYQVNGTTVVPPAVMLPFTAGTNLATTTCTSDLERVKCT